MKKTRFPIFLIFAVAFILNACNGINTDSQYIKGLSIDNYPVVDGSTSTLPLNNVIACELLGIKYDWQETLIDRSSSMWAIEPKVKGNLKKKLEKRVLSNQTHGSIMNLIDNKVDITLSARKMSPDERAYAESKGVTLIETPIALDAFVFIVSADNPVKNLSTQNIRDIYTGKITNWIDLDPEVETKPSNPEVYPESAKIRPYIRNKNSGSQELMDELIMKDLEYIDLPIYQEQLIFTMAGLLDAIGRDVNAIGYTVLYYNDFIIRPHEDFLKKIAIDGVAPTKEAITKHTYPYTIEVYASIRSDLDQSSMAYKVYEWLQTPKGKEIIAKSGYIPN